MTAVQPAHRHRSELEVDVVESDDSAEAESSANTYKHTEPFVQSHPATGLSIDNNSQTSSAGDWQHTEQLKADLDDQQSTATNSTGSPSPVNDKSSLESSHNSQTDKMASAFPGHSVDDMNAMPFSNHLSGSFEGSCEINRQPEDWQWPEEDSKLAGSKMQAETCRSRGQSSNFTTSNTATSYGTSRQTSDPSCKLSVKSPSKVERELAKKQLHKFTPSKFVVVFKWVATFFVGLLGLACLMGSRISFVSIAVRLRIPENGENNSSYAFTMVTMILLIPNVFNLLRSTWMGLSRKDMPWPSKRSIVWIVATSIVECFGICLFAFKIFGLQFGVTGIAMGGTVFIVPMMYMIYRRTRCDSPQSVGISCGIGIVLLVIVIIVAVWRGFTVVTQDWRNVWHLPVAVICLTVTWIPKVQKRLISLSPSSGGSPASVKTTDSQDAADVSEVFDYNVESGRFQASQRLENVVENTQNVVVNMETRSFWKSAIIMSACRIPAMILFSVVLYFFDTDKSFPDGALESFRDSWGNITSDSTAFHMFIINIVSTLVGYFISLVACRINMQRGAFVLPLAFSTPGVMAIVSGFCTSGDYFKVPGIESDDPVCASGEVVYTAVCSGILLLAVCLSFGWVIWTTDTIIMCSESEVFWSPTYPGVMLHEWLLVSRRNKVTHIQDAPQRVAQKTKVYICTTMYRENREEMEQLLKSIARVKDAQAHSDKYFESHVFFDGGVKEKTPTDFALQLISLLPETLGVETMMCTRSMTAYGMKLSWQLLASGERRQARGMTFTIHLKDNRKVKNKKRWSQIMYMSYVLDFLVRQYVDSSGNPEVDDSNAFILTTDADVNFTPDSVEALLDLMTRDRSVGAVCARTHPIGFGPLVWYQKFEYAIGHWFQKAAEDVLGSVLCAPGCFSVYRVSAVRDIVSTYATNVEKAFEFLTKDMGEDRWFCTLLVQSGWRIEYCAASENKTQCPEEFEEFYKQRRRWIASTIANLMLLVQEWKKISKFNQRVSLLFTIYQGLLLFSTLIGPSVVILVVSGGLVYAWAVSSVTTIILQCLTCVGFTIICLYFSQTTQMKAAKLLTFLYACVMMAVAVGTAQQVVQDLNYGNDDDIVKAINDTSGPEKVTKSPSDVSMDLPVSLTTLYLGSLIGIFLTAGLLHLREFTCLIHGFWYLMCLPSGYLILNIYSVCNITDRSWGTREEKEKSVVKDTRPWYEIFGETIQKTFTCCQRVYSPPPGDPVVPARVRHTSMSENHPKLSESVRDISKTLAEETDNQADADFQRSTRQDGALQEAEESYFEDDVTPEPVEEWLDKDFRQDYIPLFKKHGFDSTLFITAMKEKDLTTIGIKKKAHVTYLMERIQLLPEFRIEVKVPENVLDWLREIGLEQYYSVFKSNKITSSKDLEILKSFSRKEIESELKITKSGHVARLLNAIKHLRKPTEEELKRIEVKKQLTYTECYEIEQINKEENIFWRELTDACLKPGSTAFGHTEDLKEKLGELRNNFLGILAVANTLWLILLATLASKMELKVSGTDPVGLVFLAIFGFLLVLQFLCMLVHRLTTFGHFCARAPYRFGHRYKSSWGFADGNLDWSLSDEDRKALNHAKEGDKKIKARLVSRKRNQKKQRVAIADEKLHLLKEHPQTTYC